MHAPKAKKMGLLDGDHQRVFPLFWKRNWPRLAALFGTLCVAVVVVLQLKDRQTSQQQLVLRHTSGAAVHIITTGACVQRLFVPDRDGLLDDVVLGFDSVGAYKKQSAYFGAVVGRVANRIAKASFQLDGTTYHVDANDGRNSLHGGFLGFSKRTWAAGEVVRGAAGASSVRLTYTSADGEEGFPGVMHAAVTYALSGDADALELRIAFEATAESPTPVNMAQHSYFNLEGAASRATILNHTLQINSSYITPTDAELIPTGEVAPVAAGPYDFRDPQPIGRHIQEMPGPEPKGYDTNFVLWGIDGPAALKATKNCVVSAEPQRAVRLYAPATGRVMEVWTNSPGLQFYSGTYLNGSIVGKGGVRYPQYGALALETQMFPNFVNQEGFPTCILRPGQTYRAIDTWRFSTDHASGLI